MRSPGCELPAVLSHSRTRVIFGGGTLAELGAITKREGGSHVLLVTDPRIVAAGHVDRAVGSLHGAGLEVRVFDGVEENPTTLHVDGGVAAAREANVDFLIGLGGGCDGHRRRFARDRNSRDHAAE